MYTIAKRFRFSAAHTLRSPNLTDRENKVVYGKCANPAGHGHDYMIEVIASSETLEEDVVVGHGWLEEITRRQLDPRFMFTNLNETFGGGFIPTGENLVHAVWALLRPLVPPQVGLSVKLVETPKNTFGFRENGEQSKQKSV